MMIQAVMRDHVYLFVAGQFTSLSSAATGWVLEVHLCGVAGPCLSCSVISTQANWDRSWQERVNPQIQCELVPLGTVKSNTKCKKEKTTTPCKSYLSSLLETYRGFRVAVLIGHSAIPLWTEGQQPGPCTRPGPEAVFQTALSPQWLFTDLSSSFQWLSDTFLCLIQSTVQKIDLHLEVLMQFSKTGYLLSKHVKFEIYLFICVDYNGLEQSFSAVSLMEMQATDLEKPKASELTSTNFISYNEAGRLFLVIQCDTKT